MTTHSAASAAIKTLQALGYTHSGGELWKPPIGQAPNFDLIDNLRTRIARLEAELVTEAGRTAQQKLRADQMTEQHRMQAAMNSEARKALVEETEATDAWRQLALQFDGHRMQALGYLKALLRGDKDMETGARGFIASPPIPGQRVLAERLAAIAWKPAPHGWKLVPVEPTREMMDAYVNQDGRFHSARSDWVAMLAASPTPPGLKREPLTDEQISGLNLQAWKGGGNVTLKFARDIETAHGIRCWCSTCRPITLQDMRFVVCPVCGNKRCPRAHNHELTCTGSNAVGQPGSSWEHVKPISQEKLG